MKFPSGKIEEKILRENENCILIGVDEAGRGPLAGPVMAGAVWLRPEVIFRDFPEKKLIRDSKTLSEKQRAKIFQYISANDQFFFSAQEVSGKIIDQANILQATLLAMRLAVEDLVGQLKNCEIIEKTQVPKVILLIDGNKKIPKLNFEQRTFPRGDAKIFSIAAASICAKVVRDKIMLLYHNKFPQYGFNRHKGYGTRLHLEKIRLHGPCEIHRKSFGPIKELEGKTET